MDFIKLLKYKDIEHIRLFSIDEVLIHRLYAVMLEDNWLKLYSENPRYAAYIAPWINILCPAIDFRSLIFEDSNVLYLINFLQADFDFIDIDSHYCIPEVMRALVRKPNLTVVKVNIVNELILDGALFSTVNTIELCSYSLRRNLILNLNKFEYWSQLKYLTIHRVDVNLLSDLPYIKLDMEELIFSDVNVHSGK